MNLLLLLLLIVAGTVLTSAFLPLRCVQRQRLHTHYSGEDSTLSESKMSIDELKAELDLRDVNYDECFSKSELVTKLAASRVAGRADTKILDQFNELGEGTVDLSMMEDSELDDIMAEDGSLPGGLSKEMMKALSSDKGIMTMLKDPKMQDIMKAVMTGGPEAAKKYMSDPDALLLLQRLSGAIGKIQNL